MTTSGIEPGTFWFVAQHFNHCATAVPYLYCTIFILCSFFSSDTVSNLTLAIRAEICSWDIIYIWQYNCVKTVIPLHIAYLWLTSTTRMTHLEDASRTNKTFVRVTIFVVEKLQALFTMNVSVCRYSHHALRVHHIILSSVVCPAAPWLSALYHKRHDFRKKKLLNIKYAYWLSVQILLMYS